MGLLSFVNQSQPVAIAAAPVAVAKKPSVRELFGTVSGGTVAVLGGGISLQGDIEKLPKGCAIIGVNQHAASFMPVDYAVCLDTGIAEKIREYSDCKIISQQNETAVDFVIYDEDKEELCAAFQSTIPAVVLAVKIGFAKVILCGVDLYDSGKYFDGTDVMAGQADKKLQLEFWAGAKQALGKDAKKIKVMADSPLSAVFESLK